MSNSKLHSNMANIHPQSMILWPLRIIQTHKTVGTKGKPHKGILKNAPLPAEIVPTIIQIVNKRKALFMKWNSIMDSNKM